MMSKKKSNSRARCKLLLLLPVAALSMYAFARPDVTRQFEQIIRSEDTTIPSNDQIYTQEFFDAELNRYISELGGNASLSVSEKTDFLAEKTNIIRLLINWEDSILICIPQNNPHEQHLIGISKNHALERIPAELTKALMADYPNEKPVSIHLLYDRGATAKMIYDINQMVGKVFADNEALFKLKKQPVLLFWEEPKVHREKALVSGSHAAKDTNPVYIAVFDDTGKELLSLKIVIEDAASLETGLVNGFNELFYSQKKENHKNYSISIKGPSDLRMGIINDIQEILRNHFALKKVSYMYSRSKE